MNNLCPFCDCDPCDCGWGNYCGTKKRNIDTVCVTSVPWWDDLVSSSYPSWDYYDDCLEHIQELCGTGGFAGTYTGKVVLVFALGEPVRYFPNSNLSDDQGVWLVKDIVNKHSLDCSWYDYEITNGCETILCRQEELYKLEV